MNRSNYTPVNTNPTRTTYSAETYGSRYKRQYGNMRNAVVRVASPAAAPAPKAAVKAA